MMEDFRNIADETFPSFLGHSLSGSASVVFGNVTVSSNPGLPVAASTVARSKTSCDNRLSDVCASYLEGKQSFPLGSSHCSQSEPMGRFALNFLDDVEAAAEDKQPQPASVGLKDSHSICAKPDQSVTEQANRSQDTLLEVLPLERLEDLSTGICFLPDPENNKVGPPEASEKLTESEISSDHLSSSLSSFLENEKLSCFTSSEEDSADGDIDDEEFFDNQLEAYFQQLMQPELRKGDSDMQKLSECCTAPKLSENGLLQKESFQVPDMYQAVTGVDSGNASDEDSQNEGLTGCSVQQGTLPRAEQQLGSVTAGGVLDSPSAAELQLHTPHLQAMDSHNADALDVLPQKEIQPQAAASEADSKMQTAGGSLEHYSTPEVLRSNAPQTERPECEVRLPDTYLSPTLNSCENTVLGTTDKGGLPHSVVYQNEEGKWVTDLAYYTSFDEEQDFNLSEDNKINEEFITGSEAAALIAQDQEEFERAHKLVQPSFGYYITSPEKRQPVALLTPADSSRGDTGQDASQLSELFPDDLKAQTKEHASSASCEGVWQKMDTAAGIHESINTEAATKSKANDGICKGKFETGPLNRSDSVLSISMIASAIANASCSADPSQLAAMMMTLSNKNKRTCLPPGTAEETERAANQVVSSNVENSAFDVEKYLQKSDEMGHESEYESTVKHEASVQNLVPDCFLLGEGKSKDSLAEDLMNSHSKQQGTEKRCEDTQNFSSLYGTPNSRSITTTSVKYSEKASDVVNNKRFQAVNADLASGRLDTQALPPGRGAQTCGISSAAKTEASRRSQLAYQNNNLTSRCIGEDLGTVDQAANAATEPCNDLGEQRTGNILSLGNLRPAKQCVSVSPTTANPTQRWSDDKNQNAKLEISNRDARAACGGKAKHVTFEKLSPTSEKSSEPKAEHDLQPLEEEQYSFRPSTSPLIHSSPSEASGSAVSGSEADFTFVPRYQESSCKESVLPQSVYSSPTMSRLTYISASDSTLKDSAVADNPDTYWNDSASELSTTIVRASPTPSQEHVAENLELSCQRSRKEALPTVDWKSKEHQLAGLQGKLDLLDQEPSKEGFPENGKYFASTCATVAANHKEPDQPKSAVLGQGCVFQPRSVNAASQEAWQDQASKAQRPGLSSLNVLPIYPGLSTYMPFKQNSASEQHVPLPSFKSHVTASESQTIPPPVPTLLTGCSLAMTPFAQQHLGSTLATGSTLLSQCHGSAGFGLPAGLPCSGIPAGHVENPLMAGIPLCPSLGPSSLGAPLLCNPHSTSRNKNILNINSCPVQPLGSSRSEWELSSSPGIGHVKVPEELKFPNACCVGIASQTVLSIFNPTKQWLQVSIGILSVSLNGEKMDPEKYQCLVFKNKAIVGPYSTHDVKILFLPCHPGIFQCILNVSSWPVSADAKTIIQAEALASRVVLTAVAETPDLEVETGQKGILDFGDLTFGSWKALPLKLVNKTHAFVPLRLIINANAVAWSCFTFSKEPVSASNEQSLQTDAISQTAAPSVVNHVIHASYDGQDPEALTVWVLFHAPKKQISCSGSLGPADVFLASVDVELDSPGPSSVLKSVPLRARAGTAKIHAPRTLQAMCLSARVGSTAKQRLPLKNAGNIGVHLKIKISDGDSCFGVLPEGLFLLPGEEQEVVVLFVPNDVRTIESSLTVLVLPSGPQYEVVLKGEVVSERNRPVPTAVGDCSNIPPILSNKQFVAWGGVPLGTSVQQKLALRNDSPTVTQHLRLLIRGQDQDCFQLKSIFGSEERSTINWELKIRPKEDADIYLMFTPTRTTCCFAKLEIKQLGIRSQPGIKFTIPLSGYGGTSNVTLENIKKFPDNYVLDLNESLPSKIKKASLHVRNTGSRAAYVRAVCFENLGAGGIMDPQVLNVSPDKFVVREGTHEVVTVTWNPVEEGSQRLLLAAVCFFWGDEVSRQQYCRYRNCESEVEKHIIAEQSLLRDVVFDEEFQGEQLVTEVCDIPRKTNHVHLFYGSMRRSVLCVLGYCMSDLDVLQQAFECSLDLDSVEDAVRRINASLDVLPVKGPQVPPLPVKTDELVQNKLDTREPWTVEPECLTLASPSISGATDTGHVQIVNNSKRTLPFELTWPVRCLTVTPQHGVVDPESSTQILVSPNPSLATKPSLIPWSGLIYIHCDNEQKSIRVQIHEAVAGSVPGTDPPPLSCAGLAPQSAGPAACVVKPRSVLPLTKVEIKNRTVSFPRTRPGLSSGSYLEMQNGGDEDVRWRLSLVTPPYVKDVDRTGCVRKAACPVFRCSRVSGTLEAHGEEKVAAIFLPRDEGDYLQFWDLECHPVEKSSCRDTIRFLFTGTGSEKEIETSTGRASASALTKSELPVAAERKLCSEARRKEPGQSEIIRGVYAPENVYTFPPTRVGESCTLKVNLRNNSFTTHQLKFIHPREPFYIKHSKYSLRSHHYINVPVQFKPKEEGEFTGLLIVLSTKCGSLSIRLYGSAVATSLE
ncbi:centrosomal protein of 192 kDa isoform X2 [Pogoniulus pusillus]|uniref:centrosomal protein of 192 kDa isoform X2 n=1 Tax=Pogoniulus pusillus TaxID=488313 RepID=UPI0030B93C59